MENQAETQKLLAAALKLSVAERYRLAFLIAESLGYTLVRTEKTNETSV